MSLSSLRIVEECELPNFPSSVKRLSLKQAFAVRVEEGCGSRVIITFEDEDIRKCVVSINSETINLLSSILKGLS